MFLNDPYVEPQDAPPTPRGRYAPSPTGPLHLGNLRTALVCWMHMRLLNGALILRIEDLDEERVVPECTQKLMDDLLWLGLEWDEGPRVGGPHASYMQSQRLEHYARATEALEAQGVLYKCLCSRKEIRQVQSAPHGRTHVYPGTCRDLTPQEYQEQASLKDGRAPVLRVRVGDRVIAFEDGIYGPQTQDLAAEVGDFIVMRRDGFFAYQLAVVVDDALMSITHVLRGEDLLESTPRQLLLYEYLNQPAPTFFHVPLMQDNQGIKLSKRDGASSLDTYRDSGWSADRVIGHLAYSLNLVDRDEPISPQELVDSLSLEAFVRTLQNSEPA